MKKCPTCNRTFTDDALSFCLDDGSPLLSVGSSGGPPSYDPGATIQYNPGRDTNPPPPPAYTPSQVPGYQPQPPAWTPMPPSVGMPVGAPQKKSKGIYWIVGIIAVVVVLGIGGIILAVVLVGMSNSNTNNGNANNSNTTANRNANANNANNSNSAESNKNTNSDSAKVYVAQDDFSAANWWVGSNEFGKAEYVNGEYQLTGMSEGGYVAVYGPKTYDTKNSTTRVTAHSVTGVSPDKGFGLTVYGEMKNGQLEDYAFVIRTDSSPAFRVYLHKEGKETTLVNWTDASQIRSGSATNQLEVRATESQVSFYINGQYATSIADTAGYKGGIAGFYTSGTTPVAFDDLDIFR